MTTYSKSFWLENSIRSFQKIKELSEKYKTWSDIQKSDEEFKSSTWRMIKNFRESIDNDKAYKFKKLDGRQHWFGWMTLTGQFTLLF